MTLSATNPVYPQGELEQFRLPFTGIDRRLGQLHYVPGSMEQCQSVWLRKQILETLPPCTATTISDSKAPWCPTANEGYFLGVAAYYMLSDNALILSKERIMDFSSTFYNKKTGPGTVSKTAATQITGVGTTFSQDGLSFGTRIYINDVATWYTVSSVTSDLILNTVEALPAFAGSNYDLVNRAFVTGNAFTEQVRHCWVAGRLIILGQYGVYAHVTGTTWTECINRINRGADIIAFAGRPVVLGARTAATDWASAPTGIEYTRMAWPTRGDITDWTSYGAGELYVLDDGAALRAGCNWGEEAYIWTGKKIHRLVETGISAANPIAVKPVSVEGDIAAPVSNVVAGSKGMYYATRHGLERFDGKSIAKLWKKTGWDPTYAVAKNATVSYDPVLQMIILSGATGGLSPYYFFEETETFVDPGSWKATSIATNNDRLYGIRDTTATGATVIAREFETSGTLSLDGTALTGIIRWQGVVMKEGPHVYKVVHQLRITYEGVGTIKVNIQPQGGSESNTDVVLPDTGGDIWTELMDAPYDEETAVFEFYLQFPYTVKIHELELLYTVGGDVF